MCDFFYDVRYQRSRHFHDTSFHPPQMISLDIQYEIFTCSKLVGNQMDLVNFLETFFLELFVVIIIIVGVMLFWLLCCLILYVVCFIFVLTLSFEIVLSFNNTFTLQKKEKKNWLGIQIIHTWDPLIIMMYRNSILVNFDLRISYLLFFIKVLLWSISFFSLKLTRHSSIKTLLN